MGQSLNSSLPKTSLLVCETLTNIYCLHLSASNVRSITISIKLLNYIILYRLKLLEQRII
jgi:hypothetical protein